jgi:hypothetical protein
MFDFLFLRNILERHASQAEIDESPHCISLSNRIAITSNSACKANQVGIQAGDKRRMFGLTHGPLFITKIILTTDLQAAWRLEQITLDPAPVGTYMELTDHTVMRGICPCRQGLERRS